MLRATLLATQLSGTYGLEITMRGAGGSVRPLGIDAKYGREVYEQARKTQGPGFDVTVLTQTGQLVPDDGTKLTNFVNAGADSLELTEVVKTDKDAYWEYYEQLERDPTVPRSNIDAMALAYMEKIKGKVPQKWDKPEQVELAELDGLEARVQNLIQPILNDVPTTCVRKIHHKKYKGVTVDIVVTGHSNSFTYKVTGCGATKSGEIDWKEPINDSWDTFKILAVEAMTEALDKIAETDGLTVTFDDGEGGKRFSYKLEKNAA